MTDEELLAALRSEETAATSFRDSDLAKAQEAALKHFHCKPYGDELEGRSKIVSADLRDTINWVMPDLLRPIRQQDELVTVETDNAEDDEPDQMGRSQLDIQAAYLNHVMFRDNQGLIAIHDFAFDGLLQRLGVMRVAWEEPQPKPPRTLMGVQGETLQKYVTDPEYEILNAEEAEPGSGVFKLRVRHKPKMGRVRVEPVPPEEVAIAKGAKSVKDAKYTRRKRRVFVADMARMYPEKKQALKERKTRFGSMTDDGRESVREHDGSSLDPSNPDKGREQCDLIEEWIRIDFDDDDIVELRCIKRVDDVILENEEVEDPELVTWTPFRISHKIDGHSLDDILSDLQRIRTVITRAYLDGLGETISPRTYVDTSKLDERNGTLAALQRNDRSAVIPVRGNPNEVIVERVSPDISGPSLAALEHFDNRVQEASGVTRQAQGMDPQAMNKTATGIDLLQAAAKTRIEMIATWLGLGLEDVFKAVHKLLVLHQDGPRMVKLFGKPLQVDPRRWSDEAAVSVHVGSAGVSRNQRISNLMMIAQKQEQIMLQTGPVGPLVTLQHYRSTLAGLSAAMGFSDPSAHWGEIPDDYQPTEPQPDPKAQAEQAKLQMAQEAAQAKNATAMEAIKLKAMEMQAKHTREIEQMQTKFAMDAERMDRETKLALAELRAEIALSREKSSMDAENRAADRQHKADISNNRPGGQLNA
jgi:hypothetical protein